MKEESSLYNDEFFAAIRSSSRTSAGIVVPLVMEVVAPSSVVDVGCGSGEWLRAFVDCGVDRYLGIDGAWGDHLSIPREHFLAADLGKPLGFGEALDQSFDLAMSLEVAEHLEPERATGFVADLTALAPTVLFGAAIPGQGGVGHINEQWQEYWVELFAARGYAVRDVIRPRIWNDDDVSFWYRQNAFLFVRDGEPSGTPLNLVHPIHYESVLLAQDELPSLRETARKMPRMMKASLNHHWGRLSR